MQTAIVKLSSGYEVEVRPCPPTAYLDVELAFNRKHPPLKRPTVRMKSAAGHEEEMLAEMNSPEWAEYDHAKEIREQELFHAKMNFAYNFSVVRWRLIGKPEWQAQPPDDWQPDDLIPDKDSPHRVLFIKYELIQTLGDDQLIGKAKSVMPLEEGEIETALEQFPVDDGQPTASARSAKRQGHKG